MSDAWSARENSIVVDTYFTMLQLELGGQAYNKAEFRRGVMDQIDRSNGSIEFKFQNISAAMMEIGAVPIVGYKPAVNIQSALRDQVSERLDASPDLLRSMLHVVEAPVPTPSVELGKASDPPDAAQVPRRRQFIPAHVDFQAREAANRELGLAGEASVVRAERRRLTAAGRTDLASKVRHVSVLDGDGAGYDVLSWDVEGEERFLEVKTTRFGSFQPFLVSRNEVEFSESNADKFKLVRVFGFERPSAGFYALPGSLRQSVSLEPTVYSAYPATARGA